MPRCKLSATFSGGLPPDQAAQEQRASVCDMQRFAAAVRYSWSAGPMALVAVVLLVVGPFVKAPASTAMIGAGSALAGAASARFIDLDRERRAELKQEAKRRHEDLDETRRLAYFALMTQGSRNYELAATVANAIEHHQRAAEWGVAFQHLKTLADGGPGDTSASEEWLYNQIFGITDELGDVR